MLGKTARSARSRLSSLAVPSKKFNWRPLGPRAPSRALGAGDTSNFLKRKYYTASDFCGYCAIPLTQYRAAGSYKLDCLHEIHSDCVCHAMVNRGGRVSCWICSGWTEFRSDYGANEEDSTTGESRKKAITWRVQRGANGAINYPVEDSHASASNSAEQHLVELAEFQPARLLLCGVALPARATGVTLLTSFPAPKQSTDEDERRAEQRRQRKALNHVVQLVALVSKAYPRDLCQRLYDYCFEKFAEPERARFAAAIHKHLVRILNDVPEEQQQAELYACFKHVDRRFLMSFAEQVFAELSPDHQLEFLFSEEQQLAERLRLNVHSGEFWSLDDRREFMMDLFTADNGEQRLFNSALTHLSKSERQMLQSALAMFGYIDLEMESLSSETQLFQAVESARVQQQNLTRTLPNEECDKLSTPAARSLLPMALEHSQ